MGRTIETYITVHDQNIIADCENSGQFASLDHTYLFVGPRPVDNLPPGAKVIVCRDYLPNYEHLPQFYDLTGWFVLAKHGLITSSHVLMLQYDHLPLHPDSTKVCLMAFTEDVGVVSFVPGYYNNWYLQVEGFEETLKASSLSCGVDLTALEEESPFDQWPSTQGTAWDTNYFTAFMQWFEPVFEVAKDHILAGHIAERMLNVYTMITTPPAYRFGLFQHGSLDCHGTADFMRGNHASYALKNAEFLYQSS